MKQPFNVWNIAQFCFFKENDISDTMHILTATETLSWNPACCFKYYSLIQTFTMIQTVTGTQHYFSNVYCKTFWLVPLLLMLLNIQLMMIFHIKTLQEKTTKEISICHTTVQHTGMVYGFFLLQYDYDVAQYNSWLSTNLHGSTCQRTVIWIFNSVRMSYLWTTDSKHGKSFNPVRFSRQ